MRAVARVAQDRMNGGDKEGDKRRAQRERERANKSCCATLGEGGGQAWASWIVPQPAWLIALASVA